MYLPGELHRYFRGMAERSSTTELCAAFFWQQKKAAERKLSAVVLRDGMPRRRLGKTERAIPFQCAVQDTLPRRLWHYPSLSQNGRMRKTKNEIFIADAK
jgi:hypothetical protein